MTERVRSASTTSANYRSSKMENDLSPRKTMLVVVIVVGCFAVLWPKVFYPMLVGSANQHIKPSPIDKTTGCCDVISEIDINTIKIMSELCGTIIRSKEEKPLTGKEIVQRCRQEVLETCGIDISVVLQEQVRLGQNVKQILDEVRSLNGSLCLKYNYGVAPWRLGVPHRITVKLAPDIPHIRQERPHHLRSELIHPAFRERGRAIPQPQAASPSRPSPRVVEGRPGPLPGMRPTIGGAGHVVPPSKQGTSSMSVIMPIYTIGIVIFFTYTLMRIIFKKQPEGVGGSLYPPVDPDPHFRKEVFESESSRLGARYSRENIASKLVVNAMSALLDEVDQEIEARRKTSEVASQDLVNGTLSNGDVVKPQDTEEQPMVKVLGMEMTASCEGCKKWSRPGSPILPTSPPPPAEPVPPPQEIYLEGALPPQSHLLVADSATEPQPTSGEDPAVVLAGKMTLSVVSLDSENGPDEATGKSSDEQGSPPATPIKPVADSKTQDTEESIVEQSQELIPRHEEIEQKEEIINDIDELDQYIVEPEYEIEEYELHPLVMKRFDAVPISKIQVEDFEKQNQEFSQSATMTEQKEENIMTLTAERQEENVIKPVTEQKGESVQVITEQKEESIIKPVTEQKEDVIQPILEQKEERVIQSITEQKESITPSITDQREGSLLQSTIEQEEENIITLETKQEESIIAPIIESKGEGVIQSTMEQKEEESIIKPIIEQKEEISIEPVTEQKEENIIQPIIEQKEESEIQSIMEPKETISQPVKEQTEENIIKLTADQQEENVIKPVTEQKEDVIQPILEQKDESAVQPITEQQKESVIQSTVEQKEESTVRTPLIHFESDEIPHTVEVDKVEKEVNELIQEAIENIEQRLPIAEIMEKIKSETNDISSSASTEGEPTLQALSQEQLKMLEELALKVETENVIEKIQDDLIPDNELIIEKSSAESLAESSTIPSSKNEEDLNKLEQLGLVTEEAMKLSNQDHSDKKEEKSKEKVDIIPKTSSTEKVEPKAEISSEVQNKVKETLEPDIKVVELGRQESEKQTVEESEKSDQLPKKIQEKTVESRKSEEKIEKVEANIQGTSIPSDKLTETPQAPKEEEQIPAPSGVNIFKKTEEEPKGVSEKGTQEKTKTNQADDKKQPIPEEPTEILTDDELGSDEELIEEIEEIVYEEETEEEEDSEEEIARITNRTDSASLQRVNGERSDDVVEESKYTTISGNTAAENDISDEELTDNEEVEDEEEIIEVEEEIEDDDYIVDENNDVNHVSGESEPEL